MGAIIRKIVTVVEETHLEMGQKVAPPTRRAAAIAVIENPFAGRYVEDLSPLIEIGEELGDLLGQRFHRSPFGPRDSAVSLTWHLPVSLMIASPSLGHGRLALPGRRGESRESVTTHS